jgi:hypothetical protein
MTFAMRLVLIVVASSACPGCAVLRWLLPDPPSLVRARSSVDQILFVGDSRVILRNEVGEVFTAGLDATDWKKLSEKVGVLRVSRNHELWGARGWPGHHECPSGTVWYSPDMGRNWTIRRMALPCEHGSKFVLARLPGEFINESSGPPLLLMFDLQLMRPKPGVDVHAWEAVGRPVPEHERLSIRWTASGAQFGDTIYVASAGRIFMSRDDGQTWTHEEVSSFSDAEIRCHAAACIALLSRFGSEWSGVFTAAHGTNAWKEIATLDGKTVGPVLAGESAAFGEVKTFGATSLLVDDGEIVVSGIVNAGPAPWGAVLRVHEDGRIEVVGSGIADGVWALARAPDGTLWAGGMGAYRLRNRKWHPIWHHPKSHRGAAQPGVAADGAPPRR